MMFLLVVLVSSQAQIIPLPGQGRLLTLSQYHEKFGCSFFASTGALGALSSNRSALSAQSLASVIQNPAGIGVGAVFIKRMDGIPGMLAAVVDSNGGVSVSSTASCLSSFLLDPAQYFRVGSNVEVIGLLEMKPGTSVVVFTNVSFVTIGFVETAVGKRLGVVLIEPYQAVQNKNSFVGVGRYENDRVLVYQRSIYDTRGNKVSHHIGFDVYNSVAFYDLGFLPLGSNSSWASTMLGTRFYSYLVSAFPSSRPLLFVSSFALGDGWLSSSFLTPKSTVVNGSSVVVFLGSMSSDAQNPNPSVLTLMSLHAYDRTSGKVPKPIMDPLCSWNVNIGDCEVELNPYLVLEDSANSDLVSIVLSCVDGPALIDFSPSSTSCNALDARVDQPAAPCNILSYSNCTCQLFLGLAQYPEVGCNISTNG